MPITAAQRADRKNHLGSSDIPAILGYSKWATPYDVWLFKTGRVESDDEETAYQEAGNVLETSVIEWGQKREYFGEVQRDIEMAVADTPIVTHIDALESATGTPVEIKTEGLFGPVRNPWGEPETDQIPEYVVLQSHAHMMAMNADRCHVPTLLGGQGFGYYYCNRDDALTKIIQREAIKFWEEYVLKDVPPPDSTPSLEVIKRIRKVEGEPVTLADGLVEKWLAAKQIANDAKKQAEEMQAQVLAALDGRPVGIYGDGTMKITNFEQTRKGCVVKDSTFSVLRNVKNKENQQ